MLCIGGQITEEYVGILRDVLEQEAARPSISRTFFSSTEKAGNEGVPLERELAGREGIENV